MIHDRWRAATWPINVHLGGIPNDHLVEKIWSVWKELGGGGIKFFKRSGLSVAPKLECGITQPSSRFAFYNVMTSSSSFYISPSTTISLVALVGLYEKVGKSIKQSSNQAIFLIYDDHCPAGSGRKKTWLQKWGTTVQIVKNRLFFNMSQLIPQRSLSLWDCFHFNLEILTL